MVICVKYTGKTFSYLHLLNNYILLFICYIYYLHLFKAAIIYFIFF
jgi:hypothetical protein